jgi:3-phosphoglycerate kinase
VTGNLSNRGKLHLKSADRVSFASTGSGSFLKALKGDGLFEIIKNANVEVI